MNYLNENSCGLSSSATKASLSRRAGGSILSAVQLLIMFDVSACASETNDPGFEIGVSDEKIVGGRNAGEDEFPFACRLSGVGCGCAIYNENYAITAAHCVDGRSNEDIGVRVGSRDKNGQTRYCVERIIMPESYKDEDEGFDIALLRIDDNSSSEKCKRGPLVFDESVQAIDIASNQGGANNYADVDRGLTHPGTSAWVIGWGDSQAGSGEEWPSRLKVANIQIVSQDDAAAFYRGWYDKDECNAEGEQWCHFLNAHDPGNGEAHASGDSGGPLLVRNDAGEYVVAGIVSFGGGLYDTNDDGDKKYAFYARVSTYYHWVLERAGGSAAESGGEREDEGGQEGLPYTRDSQFRCSGEECTWTSPAIAIEGASNLMLTANLDSLDRRIFEDHQDYLRIQYQIDGGSWQALFSQNGGTEATAVERAIAAEGRSLKIRLEAYTSASNEEYILDGLAVRASGAPPESVGKVLFEPTQGFRCSDEECAWSSPAIDIRGVENLTLSANLESRDRSKFESHHDYLRLLYREGRGGSWQELFFQGGATSLEELRRDIPASGESLQIRIEALTSASNEEYIVSSLKIWGES